MNQASADRLVLAGSIDCLALFVRYLDFNSRAGLDVRSRPAQG